MICSKKSRKRLCRHGATAPLRRELFDYARRALVSLSAKHPPRNHRQGTLHRLLLIETFLLNVIIGLIAGWRYMKEGLVAAAGVHFWTDVVFHVLYGLI